MTKERELELLQDILKLLRKYGPESFELLADSLSSGELADDLSRILTQAARRSKGFDQSGKKRGETQPRPIPKSLSNLEKADPQKYGILVEFYGNLAAKRILPLLSDVRQFAAELGLPGVRASSRPKAIHQIIDALVVIPYDRIKELIQWITMHPSNDRSLEAWGRVIMKEKPSD